MIITTLNANKDFIKKRGLHLYRAFMEVQIEVSNGPVMMVVVPTSFNTNAHANHYVNGGL